MTKSERRTKAKLLAKLAQKKRELRKTQSSPNSGTKKGLILISRALLAKPNKGGKKSKTKKIKNLKQKKLKI